MSSWIYRKCVILLILVVVFSTHVISLRSDYDPIFVGEHFKNLPVYYDQEGYNGIFDNEDDILMPIDSYEVLNQFEKNRLLDELFLNYKSRNKDFLVKNKRDNSLEGLPQSRFEWLKRSPKSIIIGSIAAVTLFMGIVLAVGIIVRQRYLMNKKVSNVRSPVGSIIGQESGDKKLAHSAQMYHYQFQKQQILAMEKASIKNEQSEDEGTDVETDGDFTVYECAGVQPTNDVEVKNPLFAGAEHSSDDGSPMADDDLLNTGSQRSSLGNDDKTYVENIE